MSKNTWAIGCVLTGIPCLPNGYQFIKQGEMVGFGWGLIVAGILFTSSRVFTCFIDYPL